MFGWGLISVLEIIKLTDQKEISALHVCKICTCMQCNSGIHIQHKTLVPGLINKRNYKKKLNNA